MELIFTSDHYRHRLTARDPYIAYSTACAATVGEKRVLFPTSLLSLLSVSVKWLHTTHTLSALLRRGHTQYLCTRSRRRCCPPCSCVCVSGFTTSSRNTRRSRRPGRTACYFHFASVHVSAHARKRHITNTAVQPLFERRSGQM